MPKPVYEEGDVTVLWNQAVHTDREVTANRPVIIIKNKKRENTHTDRCGNNQRQKYCAKGRGKEVEIQEFMYRDITNVEPEMYDYTSYNWNHWNSNEKLKEKFGSGTRKTFDRFTTKEAILGTSHIIRKVLQCEA
jgi:hypothetical protein